MDKSHIADKLLTIVATVAMLFVVVGCQPLAGDSAPASAATPGIERPEKTVLVLATHSSFSISESLVARFETEHQVTLQFLALGDAGEALNKVILSKDAPLADVFFGVDNTFLSRALEAGIYVPYASPHLAEIPDDLKLDSQFRALPVDFGYVNINADKAWFADHQLALPQTLEDLAKPAYKGLLVVENPATSSPGLAFLLTTIAHFGQDGYIPYWQAMRANDILISEGWNEAYFTHFTVGSGGSGDRPLVVSYATSPPADVVFATDGRTEPASVNIDPPGGTFRQIEFVGILQGSQHPELAKALVDFMLSVPFQEDVPLQMYVYPANRHARLPELFVKFASVPTDPAGMAPQEVEANREQWIRAWTDVMLR